LTYCLVWTEHSGRGIHQATDGVLVERLVQRPLLGEGLRPLREKPHAHVVFQLGDYVPDNGRIQVLQYVDYDLVRILRERTGGLCRTHAGDLASEYFGAGITRGSRRRDRGCCFHHCLHSAWMQQLLVSGP
jgi:hypothetical protein